MTWGDRAIIAGDVFIAVNFFVVGVMWGRWEHVRWPLLACTIASCVTFGLVQVGA